MNEFFLYDCMWFSSYSIYIYIYISERVAICSLCTVCPCYITVPVPEHILGLKISWLFFLNINNNKFFRNCIVIHKILNMPLFSVVRSGSRFVRIRPMQKCRFNSHKCGFRDMICKKYRHPILKIAVSNYTILFKQRYFFKGLSRTCID